MNRGFRIMRDLPLVVWFVAAFVVAISHRWIPESTWLLIHLIGLGALTHSVMVWSAHFTSALLKTRADERRARLDAVRLGLLGIGALLVFVGVPTALWWLVLAGTVAVGAAVLWHGTLLVRDLSRALPGRFRVCIRYYIAAAALLPVGIGFGAALAFGFDDSWHARLLVAHTMTNLLGWIGLTVVGTLVTFWPTLLRTRMDDRAERLAKQSLPILLAAIAVVVVGALVDVRAVAVAGLALYAVGLIWWGRSLVNPLRAKPPREFAPASVGLAAVWAVISLIATGWVLLTTNDAQLADAYPKLASLWVAGFMMQLVTGALSYLLPSMMGGGPRVVRASGAQMDRFAASRLVIINGGLLLWLFPLPSWVQVAVTLLVLVAFTAFLPLLVAAVRAAAREKRLVAAGDPQPAERPRGRADRPSAFTGSGLVAGIAALALAVTLGLGADPGAIGLAAPRPQATQSAPATGETVRIKVEANGMRFTPASVTVKPGDRLVIDLVNTDPSQIHDLAVGDKRTNRLAPGQSAELDLGVVSASIQGWCTVVGHRQMGMVFDVIVEGGAPTTTPPTTTPSADGETPHSMAPTDPDAKLSTTIDPVLPPLTSERVHRVTLEATEVPLEVGPGLWQTRWTYNGRSTAPTLHGRVGDVFEVTLVNNGTMGHSVDFHASNLAPDMPMRTIAPGESLVYRFTAERAGIWMYHCSTMPMTAHIAAGMAGAVIIEPEEGFPKVDREYVVTQSEVYLANHATTPEEATDLDVDALAAERPDRVVFNGIANQYDQAPFTAKVGERVRFWVLDIGPNRPSSFHIVGAQFDTVYFEGGYQLRDGVDSFGNAGGGSQALGLQPAQGGFVELVFPEAGHYPVVSHVMVDAERGAHGIVEVTN